MDQCASRGVWGGAGRPDRGQAATRISERSSRWAIREFDRHWIRCSALTCRNRGWSSLSFGPPSQSIRDATDARATGSPPILGGHWIILPLGGSCHRDCPTATSMARAPGHLLFPHSDYRQRHFYREVCVDHCPRGYPDGCELWPDCYVQSVCPSKSRARGERGRRSPSIAGATPALDGPACCGGVGGWSPCTREARATTL
jgi:hypothetical protein